MSKIEAVVVLSGGQDSTTVLFEAIRRHGREHVAAITFAYGQRHQSEVEAAIEIAALACVEHAVVNASAIAQVAKSAQTRNDIEVSATGGLHGLPSTFTPSRNLTFAALASSYAISFGASILYMGVCQTDFSGYPDCRRDFIDSLEKTIALGNGLESFSIRTPLMHMTKEETVHLARELGAACMHALSLSVTCYHGRRPACGTCPSCELRVKGFAQAGILDPALDPAYSKIEA